MHRQKCKDEKQLTKIPMRPNQLLEEKYQGNSFLLGKLGVLSTPSLVGQVGEIRGEIHISWDFDVTLSDFSRLNTPNLFHENTPLKNTVKK